MQKASNVSSHAVCLPPSAVPESLQPMKRKIDSNCPSTQKLIRNLENRVLYYKQITNLGLISAEHLVLLLSIAVSDSVSCSQA